jgi:hypothetical protein
MLSQAWLKGATADWDLSSPRQSFTGAPVLAQYASMWTTYVAPVRKINRLSSYHNRHWVGAQRARKENPRPTLMVAEVLPPKSLLLLRDFTDRPAFDRRLQIAFVQWRENVFLSCKEDIVAALLEAIDRLRLGEEGDEESVKTVVDSIGASPAHWSFSAALLTHFFVYLQPHSTLTRTAARVCSSSRRPSRTDFSPRRPPFTPARRNA